MAVGDVSIVGRVDLVRLRIVDVAREVPIQSLSSPVDGRPTRARDVTQTVFIDVLEQEACIMRRKVPATCDQGIGRTAKCSDGRVLEVGEIIGVSVDDDRGVTDLTLMKAIGRCSTDCLCETKGDETDGGHF